MPVSLDHVPTAPTKTWLVHSRMYGVIRTDVLKTSVADLARQATEAGLTTKVKPGHMLHTFQSDRLYRCLSCALLVQNKFARLWNAIK